MWTWMGTTYKDGGDNMRRWKSDLRRSTDPHPSEDSEAERRDLEAPSRRIEDREIAAVRNARIERMELRRMEALSRTAAELTNSYAAMGGSELGGQHVAVDSITLALQTVTSEIRDSVSVLRGLRHD